jgi:DNA-binding protein Fis
LLAARGLSIGAVDVSRTLAVRTSDKPPPANSLPALAATLLARAQRGELHDAHAQVLTEAEREVVTQAILLAHGNQAKAARWLGLSRFTLREKLKQFGLHPGQHEES